jgi:hypothetical protein
VWRNLYARYLFFCQIRNRVFLKRRFFEGSGQRTKFELVSSDQMTLLQWCMNMNKGFCSFPISQKIDRLSLGFALAEIPGRESISCNVNPAHRIDNSLMQVGRDNTKNELSNKNNVF